MIVAFAMPPPSHMVCRPYRPPVASSVASSVPSSRVPLEPSAWPSAMAPPHGLSFSGSAPTYAAQARGTEANASLTS